MPDPAPMKILARGKGYAVAEKPVGADSEDKGDGSVPALARATLGVKEVYPCHRLDLLCGGAMLIATDKRTAASLCAAVADGSLRKTYLAVCEGVPDESSGEMNDLLFFDREKRKTFVVKKERRGVKTASLSYRVVASASAPDGRALSLCEIELHTGRTHQIRAQFASRRHPLCGDGKYGSRDNLARCALWCSSVESPDGVVRSSPPRAYPWDLFPIDD